MGYSLEFLQLFLEIGSTISIWLAVILIGLFLYKRVIKQRFLWKYVGAVLTGMALWRLIVLYLGGDDSLPFKAEILPWVRPINESIFIVLGIVFILILFSFKVDDTNE